jgi:hypothetical protein
MLALRGTYLVTQVWLAAALTLLSGVPRFSCVCPDGTVHSSFLGIVGGGGNTCCCTPSAGVPAGSQEKSCCGAAHAGKLSGRSTTSCPHKGSHCRKTVASSDAQAVPFVPTLGDLQPLAFEAVFSTPATVTILPRSVVLNCGLPPPTDLIVQLGRLVI